MTKERINVAIAEALGKRLRPCGCGCGTAVEVFSDNSTCAIPNYTSDLNAMHEAENSVVFRAEYGEGLKYSQTLRRITESDRSTERWQWNATAAQRAEAFLRTIGKWEEE